jgi:hypothetical protein
VVVEGLDESAELSDLERSAVVGSIRFMGCNSYSTPIRVSNLYST